MSQQHSIEIKVQGSFNIQNVTKIIAKGSSLNFVYYDFIPGKSYMNAPILNSEQASMRALFPRPEVLKDFGNCLLVSFGNVFFDIFFYGGENNHFKILLTNFGDEYKKDFFGSGMEEWHMDYQCFIKIALDLCEDFCIQKLGTKVL